MKPVYVVENSRERARLHAVAASLSEDDLRRRLDNGLTVAAVLIHMAFWDDYSAALLTGWRQSGFAPSQSDFQAVNAALGRLALAIPVRSAPGLAEAAADAVDRQVEGLPPDLIAAIDAGGHERILWRAEHRRQHLDQLARTLGSGEK